MVKPDHVQNQKPLILAFFQTGLCPNAKIIQKILFLKYRRTSSEDKIEDQRLLEDMAGRYL